MGVREGMELEIGLTRLMSLYGSYSIPCHFDHFPSYSATVHPFSRGTYLHKLEMHLVCLRQGGSRISSVALEYTKSFAFLTLLTGTKRALRRSTPNATDADQGLRICGELTGV